MYPLRFFVSLSIHVVLVIAFCIVLYAASIAEAFALVLGLIGLYIILVTSGKPGLANFSSQSGHTATILGELHKAFLFLTIFTTYASIAVMDHPLSF
jgi:hypothetical protein